MIRRIVKSILALYHRSSIRYMVFISFTLSALLTILMTGVTFYLRFSNQLEGTLHAENRNLVEQVNRSLNTYLGNMIRLSDSVSFHVIKNMDVSSSDVSEQLQLLYDANSSYVKNITLFSADGRMIATAPPSILKSGVDVTSESWFTKALEQTENLHFSSPIVQNLYVDTENQYSWVIALSCAAEITEDKAAKTGVLLIDLRYNGISELFNNMTLSNQGYVYLIDGDGKIIYHPRHQLLASGLAEEINTELAGYRDGDYVIGDGDNMRSVILRSAGYTGWSIVGVIPQRGLTLNSLQNMLFLLAICLIYFAIIVLVNSLLSDKLTDPIKRLEQSVQQVELGLTRSKIYTGGSHEIRQLGRSIQQMVDLMRKLTDDIVEEQTQKQKSELNALQAQINPHFLYNTLDSLVWMIEKGQPEDALKIVSALARFFRLSLSKGKNIITVSDELEHARNYLMIQQMRYKNKFSYEIIADEATLGMSSIKLVLQPIVENAIYHSMDFMLDGEGVITITSKLVGCELHLNVADNGLGMPPELVEKMLTQNAPASPGSGIGIKNVHERITLYFGDAYGVIIKSELDVGTCVTLHMPAVPYEKMEALA